MENKQVMTRKDSREFERVFKTQKIEQNAKIKIGGKESYVEALKKIKNDITDASFGLDTNLQVKNLKEKFETIFNSHIKTELESRKTRFLSLRNRKINQEIKRIEALKKDAINTLSDFENKFNKKEETSPQHIVGAAAPKEKTEGSVGPLSKPPQSGVDIKIPTISELLEMNKEIHPSAIKQEATNTSSTSQRPQMNEIKRKMMESRPQEIKRSTPPPVPPRDDHLVAARKVQPVQKSTEAVKSPAEMKKETPPPVPPREGRGAIEKPPISPENKKSVSPAWLPSNIAAQNKTAQTTSQRPTPPKFTPYTPHKSSPPYPRTVVVNKNNTSTREKAQLLSHVPPLKPS